MGLAGFLAVIAISIILLLILIIKVDLHPIISLFVAALFAGLALNMGIEGTIERINIGFGSTVQDIALAIILGSTIAMAIQDTGAAKSIANFFIKLLKGKNLELAPALTAFIISIPVFSDISMILTAPIANVIAKRKRMSMSTVTSYTQLGLNLTHAMVPPTPGILAVTLLLGANLGMMIMWSAIVAFAAFMITWAVTKRWTEKEYIPPRADMSEGIDEAKSDSIDELIVHEKGLPNAFISLLPILIPVVLMSVGSAIQLKSVEGSVVYKFAGIISDKVIALSLGAVSNVIIGYIYKENILRANREIHHNGECRFRSILLNKWVARGVAASLLPLLITGMGGAFSSIIKAAPQIELLKETLGTVMANGTIMAVFIPWLIGVIMMTAVGSMTTAGMTAAAIMAAMGQTAVSPLVTCIAIGAGTMMVDHVNDSGFWTTCQFFNLNVKQGVKYITIINAVSSISGLIVLTVLAAIGII
ncbi:SLC13 family permease [Anaerotignum faecicola]|nr:SLC13 family permease [Anaerotignum faecicola]